MRFVFRAFRAFRGLRFNLVDTVAYNREEDSLQIPDRETRFNCSRHASIPAGTTNLENLWGYIRDSPALMQAKQQSHHAPGYPGRRRNRQNPSPNNPFDDGKFKCVGILGKTYAHNRC